MATKRRIGVRLATTEAARRQLMQPVVCWEKMWVAPENAPPGSTMKIYKWAKTDKKQVRLYVYELMYIGQLTIMDLCKQFSDDEGEVDEPLAPLPDEPEVVEGDEDMDQDEPAASVAPDATQDATGTNFVNQEVAEEPQTKPSSPPPPALSLQHTEPMLTVDEGADILDASFKALDAGINVDVHENANQEGVVELDMSVLGPDGTPYESVHDLGQLDSANALLGGSLIGDAGDPFALPMEHPPSNEETTGQPIP
ncbi:hypothetical protein JVT61DRAFT_5408 [Boletus reticuloceps]|uniref:Uncharacterized protein n=1 Tax=Boletus reticuloceps TaxID=495285 RepID=A0A8I2Z1D7_9AGAM|nr:hypothetical protein JVT61DRAFT_5408 [Boletus reticuloceps]